LIGQLNTPGGEWYVKFTIIAYSTSVILRFPFVDTNNWFEVQLRPLMTSGLCFTQIITEDLTSARKGVLGSMVPSMEANHQNPLGSSRQNQKKCKACPKLGFACRIQKFGSLIRGTRDKCPN
jgi:hypothetical protein